MATILGVLISSTYVLAKDEMSVKWTEEVGAVIKLLSVEADKPSVGYRIAKFTFEASKPCGRLSVYGHNYSKDDVQLSVIGLGPTQVNVTPGQKFQHRDILVYEPGHYLVFDKVHCF